MNILDDKMAVAFMSFNRPQYLKQVIISVKQQTDLTGLDYYLFQDGSVNEISKTRYASDEHINKCCQIFTNHLPDGQINRAGCNIGVALNFDRAENMLFNDMDYKYVLFLEDDLVLNPGYVHIIKTLLMKTKDNSRIGTIAAYGANPRMPLKEQIDHRKKLTMMGHKWGFALQKTKWLKRQEHMQEYLDIIRKVDYRLRPHHKIYGMFRKMGFQAPGTSQDGAKDVAIAKCGQIKLNTFTNNAKYIGKQGLHFNEKRYKEFGYDKTILCPNIYTDFEDISEDEIDRMLKNFRKMMSLDKK